MASAADINRLRARVTNTICTAHCNYHIRFRLENITIHTLQFGYVGDLVKRGKINIRIGSGNGYDHASNTMIFDDVDVKAHAIVHEAAHAVIDATHSGVMITKGTGEAAAYLSEMIYSIVTPVNRSAWTSRVSPGQCGFSQRTSSRTTEVTKAAIGAPVQMSPIS